MKYLYIYARGLVKNLIKNSNYRVSLFARLTTAFVVNNVNQSVPALRPTIGGEFKFLLIIS